MTTTSFRDPLNPEHRTCPAAGHGMTHLLAPSGPMHHKVMRCQFCGATEQRIRADIAEEMEE